MGEWYSCTLGNIITLQRGFDLPVQERTGGSYPVVASTGIVGKHSHFQVPPPGVVIGRSGSIGGGQFIEEPFWPLNTTLWVKDFHGNDPRFCYYLLKTIDFTAFNVGSGVPTLNRNHIHPLPVKCPRNVDEQRTIASTLAALDDKIDLNRRMNEALEVMAWTIFKDWFVDFGPTHAKIEGLELYLTPEIWALFPDNLDKEGQPEGWRIETVGNRFDLTMGQSPPGDTYNDDGNGLPFFQGRTDFGFRYPDNRKFCTAPTRLATAEDTLISVRAPVGDINMAWERCCVGRGVAALRHKTGSRSFTYYTAWAIQKELQEYEHTGTIFGAINKKQFEALKTIEPTLEVIELFESFVGSLDDRIKLNTSESRTLAQIRDMLLPKLMSGEIMVKEAEKIIGEAT